MSTTKGTGGDVIVLEEAAYCDPGFFYETVAPLMLIGRTSLLAISTLTSEINFYSRLIKMKDSLTQVPPKKEPKLPHPQRSAPKSHAQPTPKTGAHLQDLLRGTGVPKVQGRGQGHRVQAHAASGAGVAEL